MRTKLWHKNSTKLIVSSSQASFMLLFSTNEWHFKVILKGTLKSILKSFQSSLYSWICLCEVSQASTPNTPSLVLLLEQI